MCKSIETNVFEVASADWMLMDKLMDKDGIRSHRAIRLDKRVEVSKNSGYKILYVKSFSFVSYEKELSYTEDENRGYFGYKIIAQKEFNVG